MQRQKSSLLLLEPDYMVRHTVAMTARGTGLADVREAAGADTARSYLKSESFDGLLLSLDDEAFDLIDAVRAGGTASPRNTPIVVMAEQSDASLAIKLQQAGITRIILRPFKVKTLLSTIQTLSA